ncbi:MAG: chemotaxis protein CheW [Planctomycetota bacterium]
MRRRGKGMYVVCRVGDLTLGIGLDRVQEINRLVDVTPVPLAPGNVRGLVNLRGSLVTVLDLGVILHGRAIEPTAATRTVVVECGEERVGLLVQSVGDVVDCTEQSLEGLPNHVGRQHGRWFHGLVQMERELLLVLDVEAVCEPLQAVDALGGRGLAAAEGVR